MADYLGPELEALAQEQIRALLLDARGRLLRSVLVCQGGLNVVHAHPADCLREAVRANAPYLILAHNHPSGDPAPSPEDVRFTHDVGAVAALLGIELVDHVVVGRGGAYVSLRAGGLYAPPDGSPGAPPAAAAPSAGAAARSPPAGAGPASRAPSPAAPPRRPAPMEVAHGRPP